MVSSSKCSMPPWKAETAFKIPLTMVLAEQRRFLERMDTRRSSPNMSPVSFSASSMPSLKKTMKSPGCVGLAQMLMY